MKTLQTKILVGMTVVIVILSVIVMVDGRKNPQQQLTNSDTTELDVSDSTQSKFDDAFSKSTTSKTDSIKQFIEILKKTLRVKKDDFTNQYVIEDRSTSVYVNVNEMSLKLILDGYASLYLQMRYKGDDWLFISSYTLKADDEIYALNPSYGDVKQDHNSGGVFEWYNTVCSDNLIEFLRKIDQSNVVKIRMHGADYYKDRTISKQERKAIQKILQAYDDYTAINNYYTR